MRKLMFRLGLLTFLTVVGIGMPQESSAVYCPPGFCNQERQACQQECAPCFGVSACYVYVCDSTCSCQC